MQLKFKRLVCVHKRKTVTSQQVLTWFVENHFESKTCARVFSRNLKTGRILIRRLYAWERRSRLYEVVLTERFEWKTESLDWVWLANRMVREILTQNPSRIWAFGFEIGLCPIGVDLEVRHSLSHSFWVKVSTTNLALPTWHFQRTNRMWCAPQTLTKS